MDVAEFERILRLGLGRAVLHLQNHDSTPYRDVILDACLHNKALDRQVEGSRAQYMLDVVQQTSEPRFYMEKVFEALLNLHASTEDFVDFDVHQLFDFAQILASQGDTRARQVIFEAFAKNLTPNDPPGADSIADLDGIKGFLFVLKSLERFPIADISFAELRVILMYSLEKPLGAETVKTALDEAAQHDEWIATCMGIISNGRRHSRLSESEREKRFKFSYTQLRKEIIDPQNTQRKSAHRWRHWGQFASERDIRRAAVDLLAVPENETEQILAYLAVFGRRRFPLAIDRIIGWARQLHDRELYYEDSVLADRIPIWAFGVLGNIQHPQVRALALDLIENTPFAGQAVDLLELNYQADDWRLLERITARDLDPNEYWHLGYNVGDVFEMYPFQEAVPALLNIYERVPSSTNRHRFVERLHWLGALPDWMIEECKFDSNLDLREAIANNFA